MSARIAVTIAGSDSGGGAGIQADLKTFSANGVYGASVVTALTAQNTRGVQAIQDVPASFVTAQIDSVFSDLNVSASKIGMVSQVAVIQAIATGLKHHNARNIIVDPVMVATSGDRLLATEAIDAVRRQLLPLALVITPNLPEAAALLDCQTAANEAAMISQAERLMTFGCAAVLLKGGHGTGTESVDILLTKSGIIRLVSPRIATRNTHGTGCTLSSAIAAQLALGATLETAAQAAKAYVSAAIAAADRLQIGNGHGPTHHFHAWW